MVDIVLHFASESDIPAVLEVERAMEKILGKPVGEYNVRVNRRCASAHKTPGYIEKVLNDRADVRGVILGRQPAAPPAIDANCVEPVVAYLTDGKGSPEQVYACLNVPGGVACMVAPPLGPEYMALALLKIAAVKEDKLNIPIHEYQAKNKQAVFDTDARYNGKPTEEAEKIFKECEAAKQKK